MPPQPGHVAHITHDLTPSLVIREAYGLAREFEDVCADLTSTERAKQYGTDAWSNPADAGQDATRNPPKKGSLRVFAQQVVEKVSKKGCTTYQNIADELINELQEYKRSQTAQYSPHSAPDSKRRRVSDTSGAPEDDGEKNIRRRVYDSLNVLKAVGAVVPLRGLTGTTGKEVAWVGLPGTLNEVDAAQAMQEELKAHVKQVQQTNEQLQALASQYKLLCKLIQRNLHHDKGAMIAGDVDTLIPLPFVILQTGADATMNVRLSADEQTAEFNFDSSPFQVLEDYTILQQMHLD